MMKFIEEFFQSGVESEETAAEIYHLQTLINEEEQKHEKFKVQ